MEKKAVLFVDDFLAVRREEKDRLLAERGVEREGIVLENNSGVLKTIKHPGGDEGRRLFEA